MAELIPSLNSCLGKMTAGEKRFARQLEALLDDGYLCWYEVPVGRARRYPDFIVLHPSRGILLLEVKDWKVDTIKSITPKITELTLPVGLKTVANPIEQARQCAYQVVNVLERDPLLKQAMGHHQGKLCLPYGYGAVLANITRKQLHERLSDNDRELVLPDHLVMCKDEMAKGVDSEAFQEKLWGMFNYTFGQHLSLPQIDRIRGHLYPEIRILQTPQQGLFGDEKREPASVPDIMKVMDIQQEQLARSLGDGHRVVHGVAGSGKTLILGFRCLYLAEVLAQPILVLCFNITLAARLKAFVHSKGIEEKVNVYHFHDWCGQQLRTFHVDTIKGTSPIWERQVESVIRGVESGQIPAGQYGALLIDEGHDFEPEWLRLVTQMVNPDSNSVLLLYDDAQSIYKRKKNLKFSLASVGIQAQGRTTILKLNYRNTREIVSFAYDFAKSYFGKDNDPEIPIITPEAAGKSGCQPVVKACSSLQEEIAFIIRCVKKWHADGKSWKHIALLYPGGKDGAEMSQHLHKNNIPHSFLQSSATKKAYKPADDKISLMPIPSSKGLEFETVAVFSASYIRSSGEDGGLDHAVKCLYVGLTRAQENLLVSYHQRNTISDMLTLSLGE